MDSLRFDRLSRALGTCTLGRRLLVGAVAAAAAPGLVADARRKRKRKNKKTKKNKKTSQCDVCAKGCPFTSIQAAVDAAAPGAALRICPGTYSGQVAIAKSLSLLGTGSGPTATVLTNPSGPILLVTDGTVAARNLTVSGAAESGGIGNESDLTLDRVLVTGNANVNEGGGIISLGLTSRLTLVDSEVRNNTSEDGGGILNLFGVAVLVRTRVEGNQAGSGGGILNFSGFLTLADGSAVTGNTATDGASAGGGILNNRSVFVIGGSSISGNNPDDCVDDVGGTGCP